jgi:GAF domain-containing protein
MTVDRPDPLARLDATADAVDALRDVPADEEPLDQVLDRVANAAVHAIPDAHAVTISVLAASGPRTIAYTDERMLDIDKQQYAGDRGPCLQAARTQQPVRAVVGEHEANWPEFNSAAAEAGIRAYLSVPLLVADSVSGDDELVGSLNVYSITATAFDPFDERLMRLYTSSAAQAISNSHRWQRSRSEVVSLEKALISRAEIDQAKGILMAVHGHSADEAFAQLVQQSQERNVKLIDLAREFVRNSRDQAQRESPEA